MTFNEFKYEHIDMDQAQIAMNAQIDRMQAAGDYTEFTQARKTFNIAYRHLLSMLKLCSIRFSIDTSNSYYEAEQDYWDEKSPYLTQVKSRHDRVILDSVYLPEMKAEIPHVYFELLEKTLNVYDDRILDDLQNENRLVTQYGKLISGAAIEFDGKTLNLSQLSKYTQDTDRSVRKAAADAGWAFYQDNEDAIDTIFDQLVHVRTAMAHKLGYDNFTKMGYDRMTRLDYTEEMVREYRQQILDAVVPEANALYARQAKRIQTETITYYDAGLSFLDGNAEPIGTFDETVSSAQEMYHELSDQTREFFDRMIDDELLDLVAKPNKQGGGYMEFLEDFKVPFIFSNFNGTFHDVDVLTHEAGHAFQGYMSSEIELPELIMPTYESCEIHSMSMEFIAWPYMEKFFADKADKYRFNHLSNALLFLPYGALVDHFQHEIYNHPDWSKQERKACWKTLDHQYRPHLDFSENSFADQGIWWYKQGHIFASPFYYIDYTLAQVCAFQFWKRFNVDHDRTAWNDYLSICKA